MLVKTGVVTLAPLPMFGVQLYVVAPLAVKSAVAPAQIVAEVTLTFTAAFTVTVAVAVSLHPFVVPITV